MKTLCDTRWVERHTALEDFVNQYDDIVTCFEAIVQQPAKWDSKSLSEANGLLTQITSSQFLVAMHTNLYFLAFFKTLSTLLQGTKQDILTNMSVL